MSSRTRKALVLAHRWVGLAVAGFLVMAGLTGSVLAFHDEIDAALNPALFGTGTGAPVPQADMVAAAAAAEQTTPLALLVLPGEPGRTIRASPQQGTDELFLDPASGAEIGRRAADGCCLKPEFLVGFLFRLHQTVTLGTPGRFLMGAVGVLWAIDCVVGLLLTLPRAKPMVARWRQAWTVKRTTNPFRLVFDLHRAAGLWCWVALFTVAFSGAAISFYLELFRPAVERLLPTTPVPVGSAGDAVPMSLADALGRTVAAWQDEAPRVPTLLWAYRWKGTVVVASRDDGHDALWGLGPDTTVLDERTGAVLLRQKAEARRPGDVVLQLQLPLHGGEIAGLAGRIVICGLGLMTAGLSATGVWLWWHKRSARKPVRAAAVG